MVHAIEAYASKNANNNPLSKMLARQALQLLGANIETAVFDGRNVDARGAMLLGSMLAGQAFANSPVAAVHALAYPIGGTFHVPPGTVSYTHLDVYKRQSLNSEARCCFATRKTKKIGLTRPEKPQKSVVFHEFEQRAGQLARTEKLCAAGRSDNPFRGLDRLRKHHRTRAGDGRGK